MIGQTWLWIGLNGFVRAWRALDLGVFHRGAHVVPLEESLGWMAVWVMLAVMIALGAALIRR